VPAVDVTIRYLELRSAGAFRPRRSRETGVTFAHVPRDMPELNRHMYFAVGGAWMWLDRRGWTAEQWRAQLDRDEVETWLLSVHGVPAGYAELERMDDGAVEIRYLGLLESSIGQGLGGHLLTESVDRAWTMGASRVLLNTCSFDHPRALENYLARGFQETQVRVERRDVPATPPGPWDLPR
jgi:GNAT superfamily N-acetyltransferase